MSVLIEKREKDKSHFPFIISHFSFSIFHPQRFLFPKHRQSTLGGRYTSMMKSMENKNEKYEK